MGTCSIILKAISFFLYAIYICCNTVKEKKKGTRMAHTVLCYINSGISIFFSKILQELFQTLRVLIQPCDPFSLHPVKYTLFIRFKCDYVMRDEKINKAAHTTLPKGAPFTSTANEDEEIYILDISFYKIGLRHLQIFAYLLFRLQENR